MLSWVTTSSLGLIESGYISELSVQASQSLSVSEIKYALNSGTLPTGLRFEHDGTIAGKVAYDIAGTYTFSINAIDLANTEELARTFTLTVTQPSLEYTSVYFRPYLSIAKRKEFRDFITNQTIFNPDLIYRPYDQNFGIQQKMKMTVDFGLEQRDLVEYRYALQENFYKKRLRLGEVKSAIAKNSSGTHVYDVIYVEVVDELVDTYNISAASVVYTDYNDEIYYPASVDNMRKQLRGITLPNWTTIRVDELLQPRFMSTQQPNDYRTETYMKVVPLCYTLPNKSKVILNNIKNSSFKFNTVDFEVDRLIVQNSLDNSTDKYLIFDRQALGDLTDIDSYILGPEGWVRLDDESDQPLQRE